MPFGSVTRLKPSGHVLNLGYLDPRKWGVTPARIPPNICVYMFMCLHTCIHTYVPHSTLVWPHGALEMAHTEHVFRKWGSKDQDSLGMAFPGPAPPFEVMG